jgi:thioglycine synthase
MEAIERHTSLPSCYPRPLIRGTYNELSKSYNKVIHPAEVVEPVNFQGNNINNALMDFLSGFDLLSNKEVLVPAEIVLYKYFPKPPAQSAFPYSHTNGLASGNVIEESICHALCEVIERDAASIADLCASSIQYSILEKLTNQLEKEFSGYLNLGAISEHFVDDSRIFQDVDITDIAREFKPIKNLVKKFTDTGISLLIKDITQKDIGIPTFIASSIEWITHDYGYFVKGFGTHPDTRIALVRAITEVSQTRAANIQGARDDLKKIRFDQNDHTYKRKWQFSPSSSKLTEQSYDTLNFSEIKTNQKDDVLDDIGDILRGLKKAGLTRVVIVDITDPNIQIPTVRAIVPGLETFEITKTIMGGRAKNYFRETYFA